MKKFSTIFKAQQENALARYATIGHEHTNYLKKDSAAPAIITTDVTFTGRVFLDDVVLTAVAISWGNIIGSLESQEDLQIALDNKSDTGHVHVISEITNLQNSLDAKANSSHSQDISSVTGLENALALKVNSSQVLTDVPLSALFTDTVYDPTSIQNQVTINNSKISFDSTASTKLNNITGANTGDQDLSDLPISPQTQIALNRILHTTSTGLSEGGLLNVNTDNTKFDISAGFGYIVNGHTDVEVPTSTKVTWTEKLAIAPDYILTHNATYVGLDLDGNVIQSPVDFTATQRRNFIKLGLLVHPNRSTIFIQNNAPTLNVELGAQVQDILNILGFRSISGNRVLPISTGMTIKKEIGTAFKAGANFNTLNTQPHSFILAEQSPITFRYRLQDGTEGSDTNTINPQIYDLNGAFTAIPATATLASVQQVYIFQEGDVRIQPGQKYYNNLTEAVTGINSATFFTEENIANNSLYLGSIVMIYGTTSLNNILQAVFVPSQGTTTNGSAATPPLGYVAEDESNKQSTLLPDPTGSKYPSVEALQQQTEVTSAITITASQIGKHVFFNPASTINVDVDHTQLAVKHSNYFKNESVHNVTFVANVANSTVLTGANGLVLQPGGTAYLLRKGSQNKTYLEIYNPV